MKLTPYLNFNGNCREALDFYAENLGAKVLNVMTGSQMPGPNRPPAEFADRIMHARFELAGAVIMASDGPPNGTEPMRSAYLTLSTDTDEQTEQLYNALSEHGQVFMKLEETFFATRFAMLRDRFGINWMLIHEKPMPAQA